MLNLNIALWRCVAAPFLNYVFTTRQRQNCICSKFLIHIAHLLNHVEVVWDTSPRLLRQNPCVFICRRGTAYPQPLRISRSLAMAEFSVKSFALFMWWRVYEACSQICSLTDVEVFSVTQQICTSNQFCWIWHKKLTTFRYNLVKKWAKIGYF